MLSHDYWWPHIDLLGLALRRMENGSGPGIEWQELRRHLGLTGTNDGLLLWSDVLYLWSCDS
jgi:hypothetical protein